MKTTLNLIRAQSPCADGWKRLLTHLGKTEADDESLALLTVLESNGLGDALWTLRCVPNCERDARLFAVWCARQVQHLITDQRSLDALDVAERFANGEATDSELAAARDSASSAEMYAWDSASSAEMYAWDSASSAASAAASSAEMYAWDSASSAEMYARDSARYAASAAASSAHKAMFIQMCNGTAPWQEGGK